MAVFKGYDFFSSEECCTFTFSTMKKTVTYLLLIVSILVFGETSFAQKKSGYESYLSEQDVCSQKLDSALLIFDVDPETALTLVEEALLIAIKNNYQKQEGEAYRILGDFNFSLSEFDLSLKNYEKALNIFSGQDVLLNEVAVESKKSRPSAKREKSRQNAFEVPERMDVYPIYKQAGKAAEYDGKLEQSLGYYFQFLEIAEGNNLVDDIIFAKTAIGDVYLLQGNYNESERYYSEVLEMEEILDDKRGIVDANIKMGKLHQAKKDDDKALDYYEQSRDVALEIEDDEAVNEAFNNMSQVFDQNQNIPQQLEVSQQALQYNAERGNVKDEAKNTIDIGNIYIETDSSEKAIEHLQRGIELSEEAGDIEAKSQAVKALSEALEKEGEEAGALEKYKEYVELEDSINRLYNDALVSNTMKGRLLENTQNKVLVLEKDKELDEKTIELLRREKKLKEEQLRRQKMITWFLFGGLLMLLITSVFVYKSNRDKRKANRLLMLKSLRSQMNPHFIFNALNSVNNYISSNNERAANKYLADFSKLMRDVLENSTHDFISLSKEIEILGLYLKLEHSRFQDKFAYKFEVDESIDREAYLIPPMLIQPYIENAVWHGLRYKKEKGYLNVFLKDKDQVVEISVIDNGIGRKKSQELKTENQKILESTGLKNISNRLKIIREVYGVKMDVTINDLDLKTGEGTVVTMKLNKNSFENNV